jgi:uncharacterized protein YutE (UPF0331/DUF86 family)
VSPGQPDVAIVRRHLVALDRALQRLRGHAAVSVDELRGESDLAWIVERGLQLCAQNAIDVATHLCAAAGRDVSDYASAIDVLASLGVLPGAFAARFRGVAGFRNVLVHGYLEVDPVRVHAALTGRLDDFVAFARHVEAYLALSGAAD